VTVRNKEETMTYLGKAALAIAGALALTTTSASAAIICNEEGDCWHAKEKYEYRPEFKLHIYGDDWKWSHADHHKYRWREHNGRGYWNKGVWLEF
jgi:hypothetical protein